MVIIAVTIGRLVYRRVYEPQREKKYIVCKHSPARVLSEVCSETVEISSIFNGPPKKSTVIFYFVERKLPRWTSKRTRLLHHTTRRAHRIGFQFSVL